MIGFNRKRPTHRTMRPRDTAEKAKGFSDYRRPRLSAHKRLSISDLTFAPTSFAGEAMSPSRPKK
jgi:hypothetical protein